jgi:DNA polymerase III subunit epsilon
MTFPNEIAVVDVETTGLFPGGHDRIVEIGIVRMTVAGETLEEYVSLVNPERDIGPTDIHGIRARDVLDAPTFADLVGDVCGRIRGAIVGGHNVQFDARFIEAELRRAGHELPPVKLLCTMTALGGSLASCCRAYQVELGQAHSAIDDARATARLLSRWLAEREDDEPLLSLVTDFGEGSQWPSVEPAGISLKRQEAAATPPATATYLAQLVERLPAAAGVGTPVAFAVYYGILDRVLEDRRVSDVERDEIERLAAEWGLSRGHARDAHVAYLSRLATQALSDGIVSDAERRDLHEVAKILGLEPPMLEALLTAPTRAQPAGNATAHESFAGKSVCFTGQLMCRIRGDTIEREQAEALAGKAGMVVLRGVTKKLDILVLADPDTQSGKAKKARDYGTRLMGEVVFWRAIGVVVD